MIARIEELMRVRGLSPAQVARAGGMDKSTLSNILSGKRPNPTARTLEQIATGLSTTLDYLRGNTDDPNPSPAAAWPDFALDVLEAMRSLPSLGDVQDKIQEWAIANQTKAKFLLLRLVQIVMK